jgi:hypothetical protein
MLEFAGVPASSAGASRLGVSPGDSIGHEPKQTRTGGRTS